MDNVGFDTLCDRRARQADLTSPLVRCALVVTKSCNLRCVYCNTYTGDHMATDQALAIIDSWAEQRLDTVVLTGGEPTVHPRLDDIVRRCADRRMSDIVLASNGTAPVSRYARLLELGVTALSVSLDSGNRERAATIHRANISAWDRAVATIRSMSRRTDLAVNLVLNPENEATALDDLAFIHSLEPTDIRLCVSSQDGDTGRLLALARRMPERMLDRYPFLGYRMRRALSGRPMKTLGADDASRCWLGLDDMTVASEGHYPCFLYYREGGAPIGPAIHDIQEVRRQRLEWILSTDTHRDPICSRHCVDCYVDYNNEVDRLPPYQITHQ